MHRSPGVRALAGPGAALIVGGLLLAVGGRLVLLDHPGPLRWAIAGAGLVCSVVGTHWWYVVRDRQRLLRRLQRHGANVAGIVREVRRSQRVVAYEYTVDGGRHFGRTLGLPRDRLAQLENGTTVTVVYDRTAPDRSVLEIER